MMYDWLLKKDDYRPKRDRDVFIDRSLLSIISKISRMKKENHSGEGFLYMLDPGIKMTVMLAMVITVSLLRDLSYIVVVFSYLMLNVALLDLDEIKKVVSVCFLAFVFTALILMPSMLVGNLSNGLAICIKVVSSVSAVNIFAYTTKNHQITKTMKLLKMPDTFILIMDITIRYVIIVGDIAVNMLYALKKRSIGVNRSKTSSLSGIIGFLFIRSKKMSEDVHSSMICRGFNGQYVVSRQNSRIGYRDYVYLVVNFLLIAGVLL